MIILFILFILFQFTTFLQKGGDTWFANWDMDEELDRLVSVLRINFFQSMYICITNSHATG